ncbi:MAG: hypothetical protein ACT443_08595 [Gemmatimonadota bacterium]
MSRATAVLAAFALMVTSCATVTSLWRSEEEDRLETGVRALGNGDYRDAHHELSWVAQHSGDQTEGQRALLLLAALEIDPRNPNRRPALGSGLAAAYLRLEHRAPWLEPIAQTLYLIGTELGEAEQQLAEQERERERERPLPRLPGPTVTARIRSVEQERDRLARRVASLEEQLAETQRELERVRKTVKQ